MTRTAVVLAGGAARGAYEVGVLQYVCEEVARALGRDVPLDVICGTSVGAINACFLAAFADEPRARARRLETQWTGLRVNQVLRFDSRELLGLARSLIGGGGGGRNALLDPAGLQGLVAAGIPFSRIGDNLRAGRLQAVTVSTTQVATGRTVVFVQRLAALPPWGRSPTVIARAAGLTAQHALASAAIPFLFPPVTVDGENHCDGGVRQNVPLSPARRLGADRALVISPKYVRAVAEPVPGEPEPFPGPLFLLGKVLNAFLLDRLENDIDRLRKVTAILEAGTAVYGPGFVAAINRRLGAGPGRELRPLETVLIRASQDIAKLASDYIRSPSFVGRTSGMVGRLLRRLGEGGSDLASYLLFDGDFARQLIELGRDDARAHHEALCRLFAARLERVA